MSNAKNEHFIVFPVKSGTFFAVWTSAHAESDANQHIVFSTSKDKGNTWTTPVTIAGPDEVVPDGTGMASWAFPIYVESRNRIYVFYLRNTGPNDFHKGLSGDMRFVYTEDEGATWSAEHTVEFRRTAIMSPDPAVPQNWIIWQHPVEITPGRIMGCGTIWASKSEKAKNPAMPGGTECWFWEFDNILTENDPAKLHVNMLPDGPCGVRMPESEGSIDSAAEEPTIVRLSDGRWFSVFRTHRGCVGYSISSDEGKTWSQAQPLRYRDDGRIVLHPRSSCPLYPLEDERFLLTTHNNDGSANGGRHPYDAFRNRTPTFYLVGKEMLDKQQPVWFSSPIKFLDNQAKPTGPEGRSSVGIYTSFFIFEGKRYYFYPDRKHFLLCRYITDAMLA
ncbi:MAG: sialidase family protein, partial [Pirellulales bacterium]